MNVYDKESFIYHCFANNQIPNCLNKHFKNVKHLTECSEYALRATGNDVFWRIPYIEKRLISEANHLEIIKDRIEFNLSDKTISKDLREKYNLSNNRDLNEATQAIETLQKSLVDLNEKADDIKNRFNVFLKRLVNKLKEELMQKNRHLGKLFIETDWFESVPLKNRKDLFRPIAGSHHWTKEVAKAKSRKARKSVAKMRGKFG